MAQYANMALPPVNRNPLPAEANESNQRSAGRIKCTRLKCAIGSSKKYQVIEISGTGLQVELRGGKKYAKHSAVGVTLFGGSSEVLVRAEVVWQRKTGFRKSQLGLRFDELNPSEKAAVARIAIASRDAVTEMDG
jgi:c-di-GMP-binding flagellar brake protein YcgR